MSYEKRIITETLEHEVPVIVCDGCGKAEVTDHGFSLGLSRQEVAAKVSLPINSGKWASFYNYPEQLSFCDPCAKRMRNALMCEIGLISAEARK